MFVLRVRNTVVNIAILCIFLCITSLVTTKLLTLLPAGVQPSIFMLLCIVYWLMLDNITFATDLMATRSLLHKEAEKAATKIAVAAVAAAAAADSAASKQKKANSEREPLHSLSNSLRFVQASSAKAAA
jgi:hypothetical protein